MIIKLIFNIDYMYMNIGDIKEFVRSVHFDQHLKVIDLCNIL